MEEKRMQYHHKVVVHQRKNGTITGVTDVISFDLNQVLLETELGVLNIKGKDLHVNQLNVEKGEIDLSGQIESFAYSEASHQGKKGESFWGKLLK